jgi:hypothetical protein
MRVAPSLLLLMMDPGKCYDALGRTAEARRWAAFILARKFKTTNSLTLFARKQAREYLSVGER